MKMALSHLKSLLFLSSLATCHAVPSFLQPRVDAAASTNVINVAGQVRSTPVLDGYLSYSIEFAYFPDFAGEFMPKVTRSFIAHLTIQAISHTLMSSPTIC